MDYPFFLPLLFQRINIKTTHAHTLPCHSYIQWQTKLLDVVLAVLCCTSNAGTCIVVHYPPSPSDEVKYVHQHRILQFYLSKLKESKRNQDECNVHMSSCNEFNRTSDIFWSQVNSEFYNFWNIWEFSQSCCFHFCFQFLVWKNGFSCKLWPSNHIKIQFANQRCLKKFVKHSILMWKSSDIIAPICLDNFFFCYCKQ